MQTGREPLIDKTLVILLPATHPLKEWFASSEPGKSLEEYANCFSCGFGRLLRHHECETDASVLGIIFEPASIPRARLEPDFPNAACNLWWKGAENRLDLSTR